VSGGVAGGVWIVLVVGGRVVGLCIRVWVGGVGGLVVCGVGSWIMGQLFRVAG